MTKGQKTAVAGVVIIGAGIGAYYIYKSTQKPKVIAPPPGYSPGVPGRQPRPILDFFGGLVNSGKVSGAIDTVSGWFGKGKNKGNQYEYEHLIGTGAVSGPITEEQATYSGPWAP